MNQAPASELRDRTRTRDAQDVRTYEVRFTDIDAFLDDLVRDAERDAIEGGIVRLAVVNHPATDGDITERWHAGADCHNPLYRIKSLQVAYLARGQLVKLQHDCGVALTDNVTERFGQKYADAGVERTRQCAEALLEAANKVQRKLDDIEGLELRGGGLFVEDGPWRSDVDHAIEQLPQERCATCGEVIYFANSQWRHKRTRRAEELVDGHGLRGQPMKQLDHLADPTEKGRLV